MPFDIISLPNDTIVCCNYHNMKIYDENFQILKTIDTIQENTVRSRGITTNNIDLVYISDLQAHQILACDLNFNKITAYGTYGKGMGQFSNPTGIFYHNRFLFICDFDNKRIQKVSDDFKSCEIFNIKLKPYYIKIIGTIACVCGHSESNLNFYDIDSFNLIFEYINQKGPISTINSFFYNFDFERKNFCCYNSDGILIDEIKGL